jgi:prevent-host-death family protein
MKEVALADPQNTLAALVQEVEETGAEIVITRHGKPAARLAPVHEFSAPEREAAIKRLIEMRDTQTDAGMEPIDWRELVEEGRKY